VNVARPVALAGLLALSGGTLAAQSGSLDPKQQRPALEPLRLGGELVVSTYTGIGGFLIGRYVGGTLADMMPSAAESTRENIAHWTGLAAGGAGTAGGVFAIGAIGNQTGSFPVTFIGAGAGYVVALAVSHFVDRPSGPAVTPEKSRARWLQASLESLLPAIGATIAFNSTRRYK